MDPYRFAANRVLLAPLAGVTDMAFRELAREQGAGMTFTEMVSAKGIQYKNEKTFSLLQIGEKEGKAGVQLFGREPDILAQTAARLEETAGKQIALFDINMGCPAPKIVNNGEGSALMREPGLAGRIIRAVKAAVDLPVTVKFRKGFDKEEDTCVAFAQMAEQAGADGITVHGRTRAQFYEGKADWKAIARVKKAVSIPVNANGDIFSPEDAKAIWEETGADGIMVARGALGNPFLFRQIHEFLKTGAYTPVTLPERMEMAVRQAEAACRYKGERVAMREMRKHGAWYLKGIRGAARWRDRVVRVNTLEEFCQLMREAAGEDRE